MTDQNLLLSNTSKSGSGKDDDVSGFELFDMFEVAGGLNFFISVTGILTLDTPN
jgi:hypothetical protein